MSKKLYSVFDDHLNSLETHVRKARETLDGYRPKDEARVLETEDGQKAVMDTLRNEFLATEATLRNVADLLAE